MRILVVGAAGRTGRHVVEVALRHGHEVTALVRESRLDMSHPGLSIAHGDVTDFDSIEPIVTGHTAVAFAVSQQSGGRGVHETGIANVIHAMAVHDVRRLAAVSAAGAFARSNKELSIGYRTLIATTLRHVYDDLEAMERRIMASDLDWTIVRPVGLSDAPASGDYRVSMDGAMLSKTSRIARADVAGFVVKALETDAYWRRAVVIGN